MRFLIPCAAAVLLAAAAPALAAPNDIIWDPPKAPAADAASKETMTPREVAPARQPDKEGPDKNGIVWNAPPRKPAAAPAAIPASPRDRLASDRLAQTPRTSALTTTGSCHEFQTTIIIEGRRQPAHGTVCQQPDGSWRVVDK